jgi:hypothetical protein
VQRWLARPIEEFIDKGYRNTMGRYHWSVNRRSDERPWYIPTDARLDGRVAEAVALAERLDAKLAAAHEADVEARKAREAEEERVKVAGQARLKAWAAAHGSELLRARIAEGFAWLSLAEAEYGAAIVARLPYGECCEAPDGYERDKAEQRTTPTLEEIEALRRVRTAIASLEIPADVSLAWIKYTPIEDDEDTYPGPDGDEPIRRAEIIVDLTMPIGSRRQYTFLPADVLASVTA